MPPGVWKWRRAPPLACLGSLLWQSKGAMMPAERVAMRQAREIIRLKFSAGLPTREIARRLRVAASTVRGTLRRFQGAGLICPLPLAIRPGALDPALHAI